MNSEQVSIEPSPSAPLEVSGLPTIRTGLTVSEVLDRLESAARRGKLPGFARGPGSPAFMLTDFGTPFESVLEAHAATTEGTTMLSFRLRMKTGLASGFLATLVFTVWPGVWMTDSLLRTYFSSYDFATWKWYLPLTAPFVPLAMWTAVKRSRRSAQSEGRELIQRVGAMLAKP